MTAIDPLTLAETLNNPQSIAEALDALLRAENAQIENLLNQAQTTNQEIQGLLTNLPISNSSTTKPGIIQLATEAETNAGRQAEKAISPDTLKKAVKITWLDDNVRKAGYFKLPNGLICQWGQVGLTYLSDNTETVSNVVITWQIPFPIHCIFVGINAWYANTSADILNTTRTNTEFLLDSATYDYITTYNFFAVGY